MHACDNLPPSKHKGMGSEVRGHPSFRGGGVSRRKVILEGFWGIEVSWLEGGRVCGGSGGYNTKVTLVGFKGGGGVAYTEEKSSLCRFKGKASKV